MVRKSRIQDEYCIFWAEDVAGRKMESPHRRETLRRKRDGRMKVCCIVFREKELVKVEGLRESIGPRARYGISVCCWRCPPLLPSSGIFGDRIILCLGKEKASLGRHVFLF